MKTPFYIHAPNAAAFAAGVWRWPDVNGSHSGSLTELAADLDEGKPLVLLLASEDVFLGSFDIPAKKNSRIRLAAPFVIEELLATDPATLQVAFAQNRQTGLVDIAAIEREFLTGVLEQLSAHDIHPETAIADVFSLPQPAADEMLIRISGRQPGRALIRWREHHGAAMPVDLLADWLPMQLANAAVKNLSLQTDHSDELARNWRLPDGVTLATSPVEGAPAGGVNLLQGDFRPRAKDPSAGWKRSLILAAAALVLLAATGFAQLRQQQQQLRTLDAEIEKLFRQSFPAIQRLEAPLIQARQQLQQLDSGQKGESRFLGLLNEYAHAAAGADIQLLAINFRDQRLELKLQAKTIAELENLSKQLDQRLRQSYPGSRARLGSASLGSDGVDATLRISSGDRS